MPFTLVLKSRPEPGKLRSFYPTAATCSNMLQLPRYDTESDLKKYLAHVIQEVTWLPSQQYCSALCIQGDLSKYSNHQLDTFEL